LQGNTFFLSTSIKLAIALFEIIFLSFKIPYSVAKMDRKKLHTLSIQCSAMLFHHSSVSGTYLANNSTSSNSLRHLFHRKGFSESEINLLREVCLHALANFLPGIEEYHRSYILLNIDFVNLSGVHIVVMASGTPFVP
jgi:hypothetical protein